MLKKVRFYFVLTLAGVLLCGPAWSQNAGTQPKLILVLSIDQMRFDYIPRFAALYKGGLRTLASSGAVFSNAKYRHAATETGPGHAAILSGRHPSHSGIVANEWYDPYLKRVVNVVEDPVQRTVGGVEGVASRTASPVNMLGFTIGDALKARNPESKVVGVSLKDRSAILMAGRRADAAYWYEPSSGVFVTSTYYMPKAPAWLTRWNAGRPADSLVTRPWDRLLADIALYERYAGPDAVRGELDNIDTVFPHRIAGKPPEKDYYDNVRRTPFADELTFSVALEAMKEHRLGQDESTDLLAVGFSATDVIGHAFGPDSQEIMDQLLRLDALLGKLFAEVESRVGMGRTLVVLSADHGVMPLVENLKAKGLDARRVSPSLLEVPLREALARRFPQAGELITYFSPDVYLDEDKIRSKGISPAEVEETAITALMGTGLVDRVYTQEQLQQSGGADKDPILTLFRNSFYRPRSPHLSVVTKPYIYVSTRVGGTGHGTPYENDRHVPIIFLGSGIRPGTYAQECGPEDIAPTLALFLNIKDFPQEHDSRLLIEMLDNLSLRR